MAINKRKTSKDHTSLSIAPKKLRAASKSLKTKAKLQFLFSLFLIVGGILLISYVSVGNINFNLKRETVDTKREVLEIKPQYSKIKSISIPKIKKDLIVEDGSFADGRWEVSKNGVSFYTQSNLPEAGGNTVLYGHNKTRILGELERVKGGDEIKLTLDGGKEIKYEVTETKTIRAKDVDILNQTSDHQLTIYTCSGFLDSARFVVIAKLM